MKRTILIFALSRSPWIGGIYYRKNIINMLLQSKEILEKYNILVITNDKYVKDFECFGEKIIIKSCEDRWVLLFALLFLPIYCIKYRVKYIFPFKPYAILKLLQIIPVSWIADFQHCYYPEFFEEKEVKQRNRNFKKMCNAQNPLVVSSQSALADLKKYYNAERKNVYVVHFTSYIEEELKKMAKLDKKMLLEKYDFLNKDYCIICNQFWKHKNHVLVLQAIELVNEKQPENNYIYVFTGEPNDRRDPDYIKTINRQLQIPGIVERVKILGFIDRVQQLYLMSEAKFIIQPSLFEGWGTVVEDAKKMGKKVLLSNIDVHYEQKNSNCIMFDKEDVNSLADAIIDAFNCKIPKVMQSEDNTIEYSKVLEKIFE